MGEGLYPCSICVITQTPGFWYTTMSKRAIFQGSISASLVTSGFVNAHRRVLVHQQRWPSISRNCSCIFILNGVSVCFLLMIFGRERSFLDTALTTQDRLSYRVSAMHICVDPDADYYILSCPCYQLAISQHQIEALQAKSVCRSRCWRHASPHTECQMGKGFLGAMGLQIRLVNVQLSNMTSN